MNKKTHLTKFESAFNHFLHSYLTKRNFSSHEEFFTEEPCGFGTGIDEVFSNKNENWELIKRDLDSAPNQVHYTIHHKVINPVDQHNAVAAAILDLETQIMGQKIKFSNFRMLITLHEKEDGIKIAGIHFSFPTDTHEAGEAYPLKELEERNIILNRRVEEKTKELQQTLQELNQAKEKLQKLASIDDLTGLWNRRSFMEVAREELKRSLRYNYSFSMISIDLDHFKKVNDLWGHASGDAVLQHIATLLKNNLRDVDVPARIGGEEFSVLLPNTDLEYGVLLAERLRKEIENTPAIREENEIYYTVSLGVTAYREGVTNIDELLKAADEALYEAKNKGRNCTVSKEPT